MKLPLSSNGTALAIGGLALAIATTGTAVAATGSATNITDPVDASRKARVDSAGRLSTTATVPGTVATRQVLPGAVFNTAYDLTTGLNVMAGPTTATLAVDRLELVNTVLNRDRPGADFFADLVRLEPGNGTCFAGSVTSRASHSRLPAASDTVLGYTTPLVFRPAGGRPYCIALNLYSETSSPSSYYLPFGQLTGYVVSGTYSGQGAAAPRAGSAPLEATRRDPRPAGAAPLR